LLVGCAFFRSRGSCLGARKREWRQRQRQRQRQHAIHNHQRRTSAAGTRNHGMGSLCPDNGTVAHTTNTTLQCADGSSDTAGWTCVDTANTTTGTGGRDGTSVDSLDSGHWQRGRRIWTGPTRPGCSVCLFGTSLARSVLCATNMVGSDTSVSAAKTRGDGVVAGCGDPGQCLSDYVGADSDCDGSGYELRTCLSGGCAACVVG
jgi:hypothetical protein